MVSAISVANEFIRLGKEEENFFTPMQLLKLVYIAHGFMLGFFNKPLINENVEAWKYGPVIPDLYQKVKSYGKDKIKNEISSWSVFSHRPLSEEEKSVIHFVYKKYGRLDGVHLSMITHQKNTPWSDIFTHEGWGDVIPNELIRNHYAHLTNKLLEGQ